jgi:MSHA biogenesis protein MshO
MRWRISGVTLVELVIVMVLTSILSVMMVYFVVPMLQYSDAARRAEMTDIADTALRRMGRDLRNALPNSVRVSSSGGVVYLEMLLLRSGGRYRSDTGSAGGTACPNEGRDPLLADALDFFPSGAFTDTCFKTLGAVANVSEIVPNDFVVVYNLQPGTPNASAYEFAGTGGNKSRITAVTTETDQVRFAIEANTFRYESPSHRFQVIEGPVTYACNPTAQTLTRHWGYPIAAAQQTPPASGNSALLVSSVSGCSFAYDVSAVAQSQALVTLALALSSTDLKGAIETVNLYQTVHVSNVP